MIQEKADDGSDQDGSSGGGEKQLDAEYVLKVEPPWEADGLFVGHERGGRIKSDSKVFSLSKRKHDDVIYWDV